jgi:hypothetical protein
MNPATPPVRPLGTMTIAVWLALGAWASTTVADNVLHVSPQGNDAWSGAVAAPVDGGADGPLATLPAAVELSRQQAAGQQRRIVLQAGEYFSTGRSIWAPKIPD